MTDRHIEPVDGRRPGADPRTPAELIAALRGTGYLPADDLGVATFLALSLHRPLFCEGEPGAGKTSLAAALAEVLGGPLVRLQCYEGLEASQALYDWDFPRQLMHLRAAGEGADPQSLYTEAFLLERPILRALRGSRPGARAVLLIDEIDRADDEFEALLLEVLDEWAVTIPELGRIAAVTAPVVVLTSNRTREVHDALKRRCLYHWLDLPDRAREVEIIGLRMPHVSARLAAQVADAVTALRALPLQRRPGVAETLDWVRALGALGVGGLEELDYVSAHAALGTLVKTRDDAEVVARSDWAATAAGGDRA